MRCPPHEASQRVRIVVGIGPTEPLGHTALEGEHPVGVRALIAIGDVVAQWLRRLASLARCSSRRSLGVQRLRARVLGGGEWRLTPWHLSAGPPTGHGSFPEIVLAGATGRPTHLHTSNPTFAHERAWLRRSGGHRLEDAASMPASCRTEPARESSDWVTDEGDPARLTG